MRPRLSLGDLHAIGDTIHPLHVQASARGTDAERASWFEGPGGVITALSCDERNTLWPDRKPLCAAFFLPEIRIAHLAVHCRPRSSAL